MKLLRNASEGSRKLPWPYHSVIACYGATSLLPPSPPLLPSQSKEYHYTKLQDLSIAASNAALKINVFAVVKIFNHPSKSKSGTGQKGVEPSTRVDGAGYSDHFNVGNSLHQPRLRCCPHCYSLVFGSSTL